MKSRKKTWDEKVDIVRDSFFRIEKYPHFSNIFYEKLFFLNPKIKKYFKDTDFEHQKKALMHGLHFMIGFLDKKDDHSKVQLIRIAKTHSHENLNIYPHDYYYWIEALVLAVKECDHLWYNDLAHYWKEVIFMPISFIISQYYKK